LLDELGAAPADRARLLAEVAPAQPVAQAEYAIADALAQLAEAKVSRRFGEVVQPPPVDPRRAELLAMLGDEACQAATPAQVRAARQGIDGWIAQHGARVVREAGFCKPGERCPWQKPLPFTSLDDCGGRGHFVGRWTYDDGHGGLLAIDAVFHVGDAVKLAVSAGVVGDSAVCSACAGPPEAQLTGRLYRRGGAQLALVMRGPPGPAPQALTLSIDGKPTALPVFDRGASWYRFGEPGGAPEIESVLQVFTAGYDGAAYWHWDGAWKQVASFDTPKMESAEPKLDAVGLWLWRQERRAAAHQALRGFKWIDWMKTPSYRQGLDAALVLVGADAAVLARVRAAARAL
jgi:hypothetical protein